MGRADDIRAAADREIALVRAEDKLIVAKANGLSGDKMRAIKDDLRAARQRHREAREAEATGDDTARPATVRATAGVKTPGGN